MSKEKEEVVLSTVPDFQKEVDELIWSKDISTMDAILMWCESHGVEIETAAELVKKCPVMEAQLAEEAENLNYMAKSARLPI